MIYTHFKIKYILTLPTLNALSLRKGEELKGNSIEVLDVNERNGRTEIEVKSYYDQSTEKNPWIGIALNRIQDEMIITDTDGTVYKKVTNID